VILPDGCNGSTKDTAWLNEEGACFTSQDGMGCPSIFDVKSNRIKIRQPDSQEERCNAGRCSLEGDFTLLSNNEIQVSKFHLLQWPRMTADKFGCMLEKQFNYKDKKFNCSLSGYNFSGNPASDHYDEGPGFPADKVKLIHPSVKSVELEFEHGDLRSLTVRLEKPMLIQEIQRIYLLPDAKQLENAGFLNYEIRYDGIESLEANPYKPVMTDMFIISGFDHQGAGD
jgi:hypothetical protein